MPKINAGSNATVSIPAGSVISVSSGGGLLRFEFPTGTVIFEGDGVDQTFGPYSTTANATITSLMGGIDYVVSTPPAAVAPYTPSSVDIRGGVIGGLTFSHYQRLRRTKRARKSFAGYWGTMTSPGYDGRTFQTITVAEAPFLAVRPIIRNNEATGYTLDKIALAVSGTPAGDNPSTGAAGWNFGSLNGVSSNIAIPPRLGVNRPSETALDWIFVQSIPRTDGGTLPVLYLRAYNTTGPKTGMVGSVLNPSAWRTISGDAKTRDRFIISGSATGDFVSTNQAGFTGDGGTFSTFLCEFEYLTNNDALTVMGVGDSITEGDGGSIAMYSWGHIVCTNLSTTSNPVIWCNHGASNMVTSNFYDRLNDLIASGARPQVVVFSPFSPNDGTPTAALAAAQIGNMAKAIDLCEQNGILPIIWTGLPRSYAPVDDQYRQSVNTAIRALPAKGYLVADFDAALAATPGGTTIAAAYTNDNTHPNDAGNAVLAGVLQPILQKVASAYFV